ncbi:outer membrane protein assembly factor BamE [Litorimonas cladophorae]|jgi:outer membrane protein assembly factor BamE (lipoprotein component of BamABCDE complex)|uniref:Outer membrane protein assembly factor BamE n=1 Tax=Litorimonas cladophorae TaxID=1220491 RepID=A0A918KEC1_9PROT|nr:outer membrane protein assembly factor BamE [Litorimonas cladophorae]GGX59578.1 outer membrane protein assembly factor BamE [Litorimonas cladophorae]
MNVPTKIAILLSAALLSTACNPILRTHGYVPTAELPQEVNPDTDTKSSVLARLGNPSVKSTFDEDIDDDVWYYITSVRQRYAYLRPQIEDRTITAIHFNPDGQVEKVAEYGLEDGVPVNYVDRTTPTRGRELSALEQIFGTIGRLPTDRLTGANSPTGGGGGAGQTGGR